MSHSHPHSLLPNLLTNLTPRSTIASPILVSSGAPPVLTQSIPFNISTPRPSKSSVRIVRMYGTDKNALTRHRFSLSAFCASSSSKSSPSSGSSTLHASTEDTTLLIVIGTSDVG